MIRFLPNYTFRIFFGFYVVFILSSCFTAKKIQSPNPPPTTSLKKENASSLMAKLKGSKYNYRWLSAHFTVDYDNDTSHESFSGVVRIRKDSIIWMTVSALLGTYTAIHAKLDEDSVMIIDHYNEKYFKGTYDYFDSLWKEDLDFELIHSVMIGNSMEFYNDTSKMKAYFDGRDYVLSTVRKRKYKRSVYRNKQLHSRNDAQFIWLDASDFHVKKVRLEDFITHHTFDATYDNIEKNDSGINFPMHIHYEINTGKKIIAIDLKYKKVTFTDSEKIPFIIPTKYEQIHY
jgi:hypothetical protein